MLRFLSLVTIFVLTGLGAAQAVVLSAEERAEVEGIRGWGYFQDAVTLDHVEHQAVFRNDEYKYMQVYVEGSVKVVVADNEHPLPWWTPFKSAKGDMTEVMSKFCQSLGGSYHIKKRKYEQTSQESLTLVNRPSWKVGLNMHFRCY